MHLKIHATTVLCVRGRDKVAMASDGQVTLGEAIMKHGGRKVRRLACALAGGAADSRDVGRHELDGQVCHTVRSRWWNARLRTEVPPMGESREVYALGPQGRELVRVLRGGIGNAVVWGAGWSTAMLVMHGRPATWVNRPLFEHRRRCCRS